MVILPINPPHCRVQSPLERATAVPGAGILAVVRYVGTSVQPAVQLVSQHHYRCRLASIEIRAFIATSLFISRSACQ